MPPGIGQGPLDPPLPPGPPASGSAQQAWTNGDPRAAEPSRFFSLPEERFRGPAEPLVRESWQYRPLSIGAFVGMVQGSPLIDDWTNQDLGPLGGIRLGWDHHPTWGTEMRFAWATIEIFDGPRAVAASRSDRIFPEERRNNSMFFWDVSVIYYPWGDTAWRPYFSVGMGLASVDFADRLGTQFADTFFALPVGVGLKYRCTDFFNLRLDLTDNMVFGGGQTIEFLNNFSLTGGIEFRFGGSRRAYWPWNPGRQYW